MTILNKWLKSYSDFFFAQFSSFEGELYFLEP